MSDFHFDLVSEFLDGELSKEAWDIACKTHGKALEAALQEEQAIRQQLANTPQVAMPSALREQLLKIPQEHSIQSADDERAHAKTTEGGNAGPIAKTASPQVKDASNKNDKRTLLFPVISSFLTLAACLAIVLSAVFLSPEPKASPNAALAMHDDESEAAESPAPFADTHVQKQGARQDLDSARKKQTTVVSAEKAVVSESGALEIEVLEENVGESTDSFVAKEFKAEGNTAALSGAHAAPLSANMAVADADKDTGPAGLKRDRAEADTVAERKPAAASRMASVASPAITPADAGSPGKAAETQAASISENEMDAALAEARHNTKNNAKLRSIPKSKDGATKKQETDEEEKQRHAVLKQSIEARIANDKTVADADDAPKLNLKLAAQLKDSCYVLSIEMDNVEHEWFKAAILDMKLHARDAQRKIIWTSKIITHAVTPDIIELRSDGLAPALAEHLILESLKQFSDATPVPRRQTPIEAEIDTKSSLMEQTEP